MHDELCFIPAVGDEGWIWMKVLIVELMRFLLWWMQQWSADAVSFMIDVPRSHLISHLSRDPSVIESLMHSCGSLPAAVVLKALNISHLHSHLFIHLVFGILQEKEKDKNKDRERDAKDKEKRSSNGHLFTAIMALPTTLCHQCNKPINTKDAFLCTSKSTSLIIE